MKIFAGMPHYGLVKYEAVQSLFRATLGKNDVTPAHCASSLLANAFNALLVNALNLRQAGYTHFAMLHADVEAQPGWLDILADEMAEHGAGLVSVVLPIKNERGLTSTAIGKDAYGVVRRLTLKEVYSLPETFTLEDTGFGPEYTLLVNTGCFLMDITQPWAEKVVFTVTDRIGKNIDTGEFHAECWPEDWGLSAQLFRQGVKLCATRKVQCRHHGNMQFSNTSPWGVWDFDRKYLPEETPLPVFEGVSVGV